MSIEKNMKNENGCIIIYPMEQINEQKIISMRKIGIFMNIAMGLTVSAILSAHGVISSGHATPKILVLSYAISAVVALCIGFFIPIRMINEKVTGNIKAKPVKILAANVITNLFYVLIITSLLTTLMITLAKHQMNINHVPESVPRPSVLKALPRSLASSYLISYVVTLILEPIYLNFAKKKYMPKEC